MSRIEGERRNVDQQSRSVTVLIIRSRTGGERRVVIFFFLVIARRHNAHSQGYEHCDAGKLPKRKHITYRTRRKLKIKKEGLLINSHEVSRFDNRVTDWTGKKGC